MPPPFSEYRVGCEERQGMQAGPTCSRPAPHTPPQPATRHPFHIYVSVTSVPR